MAEKDKKNYTGSRRIDSYRASSGALEQRGTGKHMENGGYNHPERGGYDFYGDTVYFYDTDGYEQMPYLETREVRNVNGKPMLITNKATLDRWYDNEYTETSDTTYLDNYTPLTQAPPSRQITLKDFMRDGAKYVLGDKYPAVRQWLKRTTGFKQGGTMNKINYFQQGGAVPQQDMLQQVIALVQAAMLGDKKATETINQIVAAAQKGDPKATQLAQLIQQVVQQMKGQATAAKWGAKLGYIKSLKFAKGGKTCPSCQQGNEIEMKACGGKKAKKMKKRYFGGLI